MPFVGRLAEWCQLQALWQRAMKGEPTIALITGTAGSGKTRLAEELLTWGKRQAFRTASAHCYASQDGLPYMPVVDWLRTVLDEQTLSSLPPLWLTELARLVPDLLHNPPGVSATEIAANTPSQLGPRQPLFQALAMAITQSAPLLLLLDDLQWCDQESLEWLSYFMHVASRAKVLIVATLRPEESSPALQAFLLQWRRLSQLSEIPLTSLNESETTELASHLIGRLPPTLATCLYEETEGNPPLA